MKLGDRVEDTVSGFKGIIISEHRYLHGCTRWTVQPHVDSKGGLPSCESFDDPQLKITQSAVVEIGNQTIGGPSKHEDIRRS